LHAARQTRPGGGRGGAHGGPPAVRRARGAGGAREGRVPRGHAVARRPHLAPVRRDRGARRRRPRARRDAVARRLALPQAGAAELPAELSAPLAAEVAPAASRTRRTSAAVVTVARRPSVCAWSLARTFRRGTDGRLPAAAAPEEIHQVPEEPPRCCARVQAVHLEGTAQRDRNRQRDSSDGRRGEVAEIPTFSRL